MKDNRCLGFTKNFKRCGRRGDWRFFCSDHDRQWIGWLLTFVFTIIGGSASIYSASPDFFSVAKLEVPVPGDTNIDRAISQAKMEGVRFRTASAREVVAKFFVRPAVNYPLNKNLSVFALVSVSPFKPNKFDLIFDPGDCRFLGKVTSFNPISKKAVLSVNKISCTSSSRKSFGLDFDIKSHPLSAAVADLDSPTELSIKLVQDRNGNFSVPMFGNVLLKFAKPVESLHYKGPAIDRF